MKLIKNILALIIILNLIFVFVPSTINAEEKSAEELRLAYLSNSRPVVGEMLGVSVLYKPIMYYYVIPEADNGIFYQWYRNDKESNIDGTAIDGANEKYYYPKTEDAGYYLYCTITGDDINYSGSVTTMQTVEPVSQTAELAGAAIESDKPNTFYESVGYLYRYGCTPENDKMYGDEIASYQWYRNEKQSNIGGIAIENATSYKYTPTGEDYGYYLYFIATGKGSCTGVVTSDVSTYPVCMSSQLDRDIIDSFDSLPTEVNITGTPIENATLKLNKIITSACQWYRNDVPKNTGGELILGANSYMYTVSSADIGKYLYVELVGVNDIYGKHIVSDVTDIVTASTEELSGAELTLKHNNLRNVENESVPIPENAIATVQWYRNDEPSSIGGETITGANKTTYVPTKSDVGKYLYCVYTPVYPFAGEPVATDVSGLVEDTATLLFDPNGGDDSITCKTAFIDEPFSVLQYYEVKRHGYKFLGWATSPDAKTPDFTEETIVTDDIILYAVWEKYLYEIMDLTIQTQSGEELSTPPENQNFVAEVKVNKTETSDNEDYILAAVYDTKGILLSLDYVKANLPVGEYSFGFNIPAQSAEIGSVKAFVWSSLTSAEPLAETKTLIFMQS